MVVSNLCVQTVYLLFCPRFYFCLNCCPLSSSEHEVETNNLHWSVVRQLLAAPSLSSAACQMGNKFAFLISPPLVPTIAGLGAGWALGSLGAAAVVRQGITLVHWCTGAGLTLLSCFMDILTKQQMTMKSYCPLFPVNKQIE